MYVDKHFKPYFKNLKLNQINEIHVKQYINDKLKDLSPTTVRKHFLILRRMLQDVLKHKNPAKDIKPPTKEDYKPHVLTDGEFKKIHDFFKGHKYEPIILLAAWCGLRRGEIFALKWDDIDWEKAILRIDEASCITKEGNYIDKKPKSKNGLREIIVPDYLLDLLFKIRKSQKKIKPRIFNIRPDQCSSFFAQKIRENDLPPIRFHDLRHYHATWLYKQGIPDQYAAQRLGHDIQVLKGIYQHLDVDRQTELDEKVKSLYNKASS
jgi:integrase